MKRLFGFIKGYKTYSVAITIMLAGFNMITAGDWSGGILHVLEAPEIIVILGGMGLATLRAGIAGVLHSLSGTSAQGVPLGGDEFLYMNEKGNTITRSEYNKAIRELGALPVMGMVK